MGKYKNIFFLSNWLFKAQVVTMYCGVCSFYESKICDNNSTKDRKKKIAIYYWKELVQLAVNMTKYYLKVYCNKLEMCVTNPRVQASKLQPIGQIWFIAFFSFSHWQSIFPSALEDCFIGRQSHSLMFVAIWC